MHQRMAPSRGPQREYGICSSLLLEACAEAVALAANDRHGAERHAERGGQDLADSLPNGHRLSTGSTTRALSIADLMIGAAGEGRVIRVW